MKKYINKNFSLCCQEVPIIDDNNDVPLRKDYILQTMGRIHQHLPGSKMSMLNCSKQLICGIKQLSYSPVIGLITDYREQVVNTALELQYVSDIVRQLNGCMVVFDVSCEIDLGQLDILLSRNQQNQYMVNVLRQRMCDLTRNQTIYENHDLMMNLRKWNRVIEKQQQCDKLMQQLCQFNMQMVLQDKYVDHKLVDHIIVIPFSDLIGTVLVGKNTTSSEEFKVYLLNVLSKYHKCLDKVILILPIEFPIGDLLQVLSIIIDMSDQNILNDFVQIEQVYSKHYRGIQLVVKFGRLPENILISLQYYLMNSIIYRIVQQQYVKQEDQLFHLLCKLNTIHLNKLLSCRSDIWQDIINRSNLDKSDIDKFKSIINKAIQRYKLNIDLPSRSCSIPNSSKNIDIYSQSQHLYKTMIDNLKSSIDLSWGSLQMLDDDDYTLVNSQY